MTEKLGFARSGIKLGYRPSKRSARVLWFTFTVKKGRKKEEDKIKQMEILHNEHQ